MIPNHLLLVLLGLCMADALGAVEPGDRTLDALLGQATPTAIVPGGSGSIHLVPGGSGTVAMELVSPSSLNHIVIERSCGCAQISGVPDVIVGGTVYPILATLTGDEFPVSKTVYFRIIGRAVGTPGETPTIPVEIRYSVSVVTQDLLDRPQGTWSVVDLGTLPSDPAAVGSRSVVFTRGANPLAWESVRCQVVDPCGHWSSRLVREGDKVRALVDCRPEGRSGMLTAGLRFSFSGKDELDYHPILPLRIQVLGPVTASPKSLLLGLVPLGTERSTGLSLQCGPGQELRIEAITCGDGARLHAEFTVDGDRGDVVLTMRGREPLGKASGWIEIHGRAGNIPFLLHVPYLASVYQAPIE